MKFPADETGNLGKIYGYQWRSWMDGQVDQIVQVINQIQQNPDSRRMIVTAWNPADLPQMYSYHRAMLYSNFMSVMANFSRQLYQRSGDAFLGIPFNIASYALLTLMMALKFVVCKRVNLFIRWAMHIFILTT